MQRDPALAGRLTYRSPSTGDPVGLSFLPPRGVDDLVRRRELYTLWAEQSGGMLGRSPDYMNTFVMGCMVSRAYFGRNDPRFADNVRSYYERCRELDLCLSHSFVAPQVDQAAALRNRADRDTALRVVAERDDGVVVRGVRILATLAPLADELVVFRQAAGDYALAFAIPVATPGLKVVCRESFDLGRSTFDHPLGSRFDEVDAVLIFDDVLVPWERLFLYDPTGQVTGLFRQTNAYNHVVHQFTAKNYVKAELVLGIAALIAETIGATSLPHVQEMLGEVVDTVETLRAYLRAAEADAEPDTDGVWIPRVDTLRTARAYFPRVYPRLIEILQIIGSSGLMSIPDEAQVDGEVAADVDAAFRSATLGGRERVRLFRLAWDVACSSFGGRQLLYERHFAGSPTGTMARHYLSYDKRPAMEKVWGLLRRDQTPSRAEQPSPDQACPRAEPRA
jgi:4-hydroxyphenylacetate 3-monooxygenase